ncbi:MAG: radical SAM family heme chaperone HemW [Candidatus Zophobacter franzmannii]|nr:radical SAM family heme chaperone HemW [Candidatus Zophobacter franzmannii]
MGPGIQTNQIVSHLYIHVPFCASKCGYCSFYSIPYSKSEMEKYCSYVLRELELYKEKYQILPKTIYFGGGTPSLLSSSFINSIIKSFPKEALEEITLEVNPINITEEFIWSIQETDINRISMGVQSFNNETLKLLGRKHDVKQVRKALRRLRNSEYDNISIDLIYGIPNQSIDSLKNDLRQIAILNPQHVSTYCLSLSEGVPMKGLENQIPDDDVVNSMYYLISRYLNVRKYNHYEISNFSKPGFESKHNLGYWKLHNYVALGPSGSGFINNVHYTNPANLSEYYVQIDKGLITPDTEELSASLSESEYIIMNLRTDKGVILKDFAEKYGHEFDSVYSTQLNKVSKYIRVESDRISLQRKYWFVSNSILNEFVN